MWTPGLNSRASLNADFSIRPDHIPGADPNDVPGGKSREMWFNPEAYRVPGQYLIGNAGRNSLRGPGLFTADLALGKEFRWGENRFVEFRAEAFNALNRTNLGNPASSIDVATVGRILGLASPMRNMQFGLRLSF